MTHADWPEFNEAFLRESTVEIAVQVMGKMRGTISVAPEATQDEAVAAAKGDDGIASHLEGKEIRRVIYVPGRILNFVVG